MDILLYLVAICLLIAPWFLFVGLALLTKPLDQLSSQSKYRNRGLCTSPGCARCNKNKQEFAQGVERFNQEYGHTFKDERIRQALEESGQAGDLFLKLRLSQSHPVWDTNMLPSYVRQDLEKLEKNKQVIRQESDQALKCAYLWKRNEEATSFWYTFSFINQGVISAWMEEQCRECPELVKILHQLDGLLTDCLFGNAFLSMLPRGSVIEEHVGMTNARLRLHFGVEIPKDEHNCYMVVGGQRLHWKEGKSVVFDDSFKHSVSSRNCKEDRIVLVFDLWNPQLQAHEKECLAKIFPAIYVQ